MLQNESKEIKSINHHEGDLSSERSVDLFSSPISYMAPGNLRAVARLYGVETAPLRNARVLELGCSSGGNLVPFAVAHPWATVIGVDFSQAHVDAGNAFIGLMGIRNLDLVALDLCSITQDLGEFDYILCHNVFSVVSPEVRAAILRICRENLAPEGVACINYNTYPGWKALDILRDTVSLHHAGVPKQEHAARLHQALDFLEHGTLDGNPLRGAIINLVGDLRRKPPAQVLRDLSLETNTPCYFGDFCEALAEYRLAYIADALPQTDMPETCGPVIASLLKTMLPQATRERCAQYLDIAAGTALRRSIITRKSSKRRVHKTLDSSGLSKMHYALWLAPTHPPLEHVANTKHYRTEDGKVIGIVDPVAVAVVETLRLAWPATQPFASLLDAGRRFLPRRGKASLTQAVERAIMMLLRTGALHFRLEPLPYADRPSLKPRLIPGLAHMLQHTNDDAPIISHYNLWHQPIEPPRDPLTRFVLDRANGKNTHTALRGEVRKALYSGALPIPEELPKDGRRSLDGKALALLLQTLQDLRRSGFIT